MIFFIKFTSKENGYVHNYPIFPFKAALDHYEEVKELGFYKEAGIYDTKGKCLMHWEEGE